MKLPKSTVNVHEAKTHLSRLLRRVAMGEEIIVARGGKPVARLVPVSGKVQRRPGSGAGRIWIAPDFPEPLPADVVETFEK